MPGDAVLLQGGIEGRKIAQGLDNQSQQQILQRRHRQLVIAAPLAQRLEGIQAGAGVMGQLCRLLQALQHLGGDHAAHAAQLYRRRDTIRPQGGGGLLDVESHDGPPQDSRVAIRVPLLTTSSSSLAMLSRPETGASISYSTFSTITSTSMSPWSTSTPSLTSQAVITPSVSPSQRSAGTVISVVIGSLLNSPSAFDGRRRRSCRHWAGPTAPWSARGNGNVRVGHPLGSGAQTTARVLGDA